MNETQPLLDKIVEGIQNKKGKSISIVNLTKVDTTLCRYFVICEGNSPSQVGAITEEIKVHVRDTMGIRPIVIDGVRGGQWVVMDYPDVFVHVFLPEMREFYKLETLWADASVSNLPDLL